MFIPALIKQRSKPFYSLEFFPPKEKAHMAKFFQEAKALRDVDPLFVSVTYGAGGSRQANTLEVARALKNELGYEPMTHLTCVGSRRDDIAAYLKHLKKEGIRNILALRGDAPRRQSAEEPEYDWQNGDFQHASDLVAFIREGFPEFCIGVAAYPKPHPESESQAADLFYTKVKTDAGGDFLVTQMFFDVSEYKELVLALRRMGVDKPVVPGVMPVQSVESLAHITRMCGIKIPPAYKKELLMADKTGGAKAVRETGIEFAAWQIRELIKAEAPGVHLYTLNKSEVCRKIVELVGEL